MIVVCAWCKAKIGEEEPLEDKSITHGICASCARKMWDETIKPAEPEKEKKLLT